MVFLVFFSLFVLITIGIYAFQNKLIFYPEVLLPNYQFEFDHDFEELDFHSLDGTLINALHFKADNSTGVVFYSHGNAGSLRNWGHIADIFLSHHYDLLIYDYRGFGKSRGKITEEKLYEDANMIYKKLLQSYSEDQIIIYGRSIGTGVASKIALDYNPKHVVLESPYYNLPDLAKNMFPFIPEKLIRYKLSNNERIPKISAPITIFHGTFDEVIYFGSSMKLEKLLNAKDRLVPIVGGHHNDLANFEVFHSELAKILQ